MRYLRVPRIGTGTEPERSPIRPDVPTGVVWAGEPHTDATYLIAVPDDSPLVTDAVRVRIADADLDAECVRRRLTPTDVRRWYAASTTTRVRDPADDPEPTDPPPRER